jgi:hypothetical protein
MGYNIINDNRFPLGTIVYANENPTLKLVIRSYYNRIYYCGVSQDPSLKELVYYERELTSSK